MKRISILLVALGTSACAHGQPAPDQSPLGASMDFFVGSCWDGKFSDGLSTDVQCFRSVYDGKFVRSNHLVEGVRGPYGGETIFGWDTEEETLTYTYWDTSGGISRGSMVPVDNGLRAPNETYTAPDGTESVISSRWTITGPDSWQQRVEQISEGSSKTLWTIDYERVDLSVGPRPELGDE